MNWNLTSHKYNLTTKGILILFLLFLTIIVPLKSQAFLSFPNQIDTLQERINIQTVINTVMFPSPNLVTDGVLGRKSIQAIQAFQEINGLVVDGKIGPLTRAELEKAQTNSSTLTNISYSSECSPGALFSIITGKPCSSLISTLPSGCTSSTLFSPLTGQSCTKVALPTQVVKPINQTAPITPPVISGGSSGGGGGGSPATCSGLTTQSCTITNGLGSQSRTCNAGTWSSYGACSVSSCNSGYQISGNSCTLIVVPINTYTIVSSVGSNGTITPLGTTTKNYATSQTYTITPSSGYHINSVLVDSTSQGTVSSYTFSNITTNHTISATFTINVINTYTLTINKGGTGTGTVSGANTYNSGTVVTATATASTGSTFSGWTGNCSTSGQVTMTVNRTCTATFILNADTTKPVVTAFTIPANVSSLTVSISSFTASDNIGVTGYLLTETSSTPFAGSGSWTSTAPTSYLFSSQGAKTLYAWVKDAAGNVSTGASGTVTITIALSNTYYLSPSGSDSASASGSSSIPWKTLAYACSRVTTLGSTIHINAGTYIETSQCALAVGVSIIGEGTTSIIKSHLATVDYDNGAIIHLQGATEGENGNQSISYLKFDGDVLTGFGAIRNNKRSNVNIHHCTFLDFKRFAVIFNGNKSDGTPPTIYPTGNSFHDNTITNSADYYAGNGNGALMLDGQSGFLVYNNTMTQLSRGYGLNGWLIKGVTGYNKGLKIYNNTILKQPFDGANWDFAIELWNSRGGNEIYNNIIEGEIDLGGADNNDAGGYGFNYKVYNNTIGASSYNANYESGVQMEMDAGSTWTGGTYIYNNTFRNLHQAIWTSTGGGGGSTFNDIYIYYNVIYNVGYNGGSNSNFGIYIGSSYTTNTWHNINILNNVIYAGSPPSNNLDGIRLELGTATNITIRNNIIQGFSNDRSILVYNSTIDTMSVENNDFYGNGYDAPTNLPQYTSSMITNKTERNNITTNPYFVTPGSNFNLQSGSTATNAGLDVGLTSDIVGKSIVGNPDIGAYEYGGVLGASTYNFTLNLKYGSSGNEVKELQKILISDGYLKSTPDGIYGILTLNAVKEYQKANNLTSDGIIGSLTREVLNR